MTATSPFGNVPTRLPLLSTSKVSASPPEVSSFCSSVIKSLCNAGSIFTEPGTRLSSPALITNEPDCDAGYVVSVSLGLTPSPPVSKSPSFSVSAPWSSPAALMPSLIVISIEPSVVSPSLSVAVTFRSILVDSLSP
ncbi:hypothetical protein C9J48_05270 [Photobacterium profundum]|uniref:Uncharacterized protein n=1 Tax=Photobacterium profundum 3TCK TaxID=314280 RepID=Q1Z6W5_9GAMM|nr:hypothetical protein P3TCK_06382 [Photobacterium profundum 3TCK]PSV62908.1 hypothetical protein C9J48_05270 [Photobacterium profundum]